MWTIDVCSHEILSERSLREYVPDLLNIQLDNPRVNGIVSRLDDDAQYTILRSNLGSCLTWKAVSVQTQELRSPVRTVLTIRHRPW